jgi:HSP20 family protein
MDRLVTDFFGTVPRAWSRSTLGVRAFPAVNVWEAENELFAEAELPGVRSEDVEVTVVGDELTIKGRRTAPESGEAVFHRRERGTGEFTRTLRLPIEIDSARVAAKLENGVLSVTLPKAEAAKPRKIEVVAR